MASDVLGPGLRLVLWLSGCPLRCPGCMEPESWSPESGRCLPVQGLARQFQNMIAMIDGITFSGGEPLEQAEAVSALVDMLPPALDKMLFTGYTKGELSAIQLSVRNRMDICVEGRFEAASAGNFLWRGSGNQAILSPSGKYGKRDLRRWMLSLSAGIAAHEYGGRLCFYGIPLPHVFDEIRNRMKESGISIKTSGSGASPPFVVKARGSSWG